MIQAFKSDIHQTYNGSKHINFISEQFEKLESHATKLKEVKQGIDRHFNSATQVSGKF